MRVRKKTVNERIKFKQEMETRFTLLYTPPPPPDPLQNIMAGFGDRVVYIRSHTSVSLACKL